MALILFRLILNNGKGKVRTGASQYLKTGILANNKIGYFYLKLGSLSADNSSFNGVQHKVGGGIQTQLFHHIFPMGVNRMVTKM